MRYAPLISLLLAADPGSPGPTIRLRDESGPAKAVRELNCIGPGITCSASSTFGTITVPGGSGVTAPNCTTGQCATGNGSTLSCTSTIYATTAVSLAANPADCSAGQYANAIAGNGDLTCSTPPGTCSGGSAGNLQTNGSGSCSAYAGSSCSASNYASSISASGAVTCSIPPGTCSGGTVSGSTGSVQYNGNGTCGGLTNFLGDGTRPEVLGETSHPAAPTASDSNLMYDWLVTTGMPVQPMREDKAFGLPRPSGIMGRFTLLGTAANWRVSGCMPFGFGSTAHDIIGNTGSATLCSNGSSSCTATGPAWATTNLYTRSPVVLETKTSAGGANVWCGLSESNASSGISFWMGNAAGAGGFFWTTRVFIDTAPNDGKSINKMFAGVSGVGTLPVGTTQPSAMTNTAYFGCDLGQVQTLHFCTNDATGSATCATDLGSNYPIQSGAWYDLYIWAPPNASNVYGAAVRLDSAHNSGLLTASSDLPQSTVQLGWNVMLGSGGADAGVTAIANGGTLVMWNY